MRHVDFGGTELVELGGEATQRHNEQREGEKLHERVVRHDVLVVAGHQLERRSQLTKSS